MQSKSHNRSKGSRTAKPVNQSAPAKLSLLFSFCGAILLVANIFFVFVFPGRLKPDFIFTRNWGFHFIAYYPVPIRIVIYAIMIVSLLPWVSRLAIIAAHIVFRLISRIGKRELFIAISLLSIPVFVLFKCKYGLLGDNFTRVADIVNNRQIDWHDTGIVLVLHYFYLTLHALFKTTGAQAMALSTYICGALYVYFALSIAEELGNSTFCKAALFFSMAASGVMQLFFGYLEITPPVYILLTIHLYGVIKYLKGNCSVFFPATMLVFSIMFCLAGLFFIPAFVFAVWKKKSEKTPLLQKPWIIVSGLALIASLSWYPASRWILPDCFPLVPSPDNLMTMFSAQHFWEYLNGMTLGMGVSIMIVPVLLLYVFFKKIDLDRLTVFFAVEFITVSGCIFVFNEILGSTDADIYSLPGLIGPLVAMWLLLLLFTKNAAPNQSRHGAFILWVFMVLHTGLYIGINASDKSLDRYENILSNDPASYYLSHPPTMVMGIAYSDNGLVERQLTMARKSIDMNPNEPRMYTNFAQALISNGKIDSAFGVFEQIFEKFPDYLFPFKVMYQVYQTQGKSEKSGKMLERLYNIYKNNPSSIHSVLTKKEFIEYIGSFVNFLIDRGRWQDALEVCDSLIVVDGSQVQYIAMRAQCIAGTNHLDWGWDSCISIINRWPSFGPTYLVASEIAFLRHDLANQSVLLKKCASNVSDSHIVLAVKKQNLELQNALKKRGV